jgi:hypothetical protein
MVTSFGPGIAGAFLVAAVAAKNDENEENEELEALLAPRGFSAAVVLQYTPEEVSIQELEAYLLRVPQHQFEATVESLVSEETPQQYDDYQGREHEAFLMDIVVRGGGHADENDETLDLEHMLTLAPGPDEGDGDVAEFAREWITLSSEERACIDDVTH